MIAVSAPHTSASFEDLLNREWLETNGLGGWASSTVSGAHSRRYHGLLVAAVHPPADRIVLLSKLAETIVCGGKRTELDTNCYPGTIHPRGFERLCGFTRDIFPTFEFEIEGMRLRRTVAMAHGENTTVVRYELAAPEPVTLELRPLIAGRFYHELSRANEFLSGTGSFRDDIFVTEPYAGLELFLQVPGAAYTAGSDWYYNFELPLERQRGFECHEDLFTPGVFSVLLRPGRPLFVVCSDRDPHGRSGALLMQNEERRREAIQRAVTCGGEFGRELALAADQFLVQRDEGSTIIAGYHWFTDWGRDTMIALPGVCLATGRHAEAREILALYARYVSEGMIPNRFPERGAAPEYNTVDATLWFFVAIHRYLIATAGSPESSAFVLGELLPVLRDIVQWHERGTRYGIHVTDDGLLEAGNPTTNLTWMDAKIGEWVITARQGKAVEINALWYNALRILAALEGAVGNSAAEADLLRRAERTRWSFADRFWNETAGCLFDYIDGSFHDGAIRPNQLFALSLPFPLLEEDQARQVLRVVEDRLYTPAGLRSLDPAQPGYRPHYTGNPMSRDSAYHQGTVWSWLLGPFITALVRYRGDAGQVRAREVIAAFREHLRSFGCTTAPEIFDGDPPHTPRGCIAQAWTVGELLRALHDDLGAAESVAPPEPPRPGDPGRGSRSIWRALAAGAKFLGSRPT